jgi:hypothetical protein
MTQKSVAVGTLILLLAAGLALADGFDGMNFFFAVAILECSADPDEGGGALVGK